MIANWRCCRLGSPDELKGQLVTRNAEQDSPKRLYIVGPAVGRLLAADERPSLKVTATGVKAFERQESKVPSPSPRPPTHTHTHIRTRAQLVYEPVRFRSTCDTMQG
jgi:hypothetical protein